MQPQQYNGFEIKFEEKNEVWFTNVTLDNGSEERVEHKSLKELKMKLDIFKKKKFERMPVFVRAGNRYRLGGGRDKKYDLQYTEAMITSVSPDGNIYTVAKGEKHGEKHRISRYSAKSGIILDTVKNRKIIEEIEAAGKAKWEAEVKESTLRETLEHLDDAVLYKKVYSKQFIG